MPANTRQQAVNAPVDRRRHDTIVPDRGDDAYTPRGHFAEGGACPRCGVVYHAGKWTWIAPPGNAMPIVCPACRRIEDRYPAGVVTLESPFLADHKAEILNLVRNQEEAERLEHPLNRIMQLDDRGEAIEITTTDIHLPRRIAEAMHGAYDGTVELDYGDDETSIRAHWSR